MYNQFRTSVGSYRYTKNSDINYDKTNCISVLTRDAFQISF